jgi:hypothetical protein
MTTENNIFNNRGFQVAILSIIFYGFFYTIFFSDNNKSSAVYQSSKPKVIEKRIETNNSNIELYRQQIRQDSLFKIVFNQRLNSLQKSLSIAKSVKDTVLIIRNQDTIIRIQERIIYTLENTSTIKDSIIGTLSNTIQNQDTLITFHKQQTKRIKKQRNWLIAGNVLLGTLLILK